MQMRLGELLVQMGFISVEQLDSALEEQRRSGTRLGKILVHAHVLTEEQLIRALSRQLGIEICRPASLNIDPALGNVVPVELMRDCRIVPLRFERQGATQSLMIATVDPLDPTPIRKLRALLGPQTRIATLIGADSEIELAIDQIARAFAPPVPAAPELIAFDALDEVHEQPGSAQEPSVDIALTAADVYHGDAQPAEPPEAQVENARRRLEQIARSNATDPQDVQWLLRLMAATLADERVFDDQQIFGALERLKALAAPTS